MRHILIIVFSIVYTLGFGKETSILNINLEPASKTDTVYLEYYMSDQSYVSDTIILKKGKYSLESDIFEKGLYNIATTNGKKTAIVLGFETVDVNIILEENKSNFTIQNSASNDFYSAYNKMYTNYDKKLEDIDLAYMSLVQQKNLDSIQFNAAVNKLRQQLVANNLERNEFFKKHLNSTEFAKGVATYLYVNETTSADNYFTQEMPTFIHAGDFIRRDLEIYFREFQSLGKDNLALDFTNILITAPAKTKARNVIYSELIRQSTPVDPDMSCRLSKGHVKSFPDSEFAKYSHTTYAQCPLGVGDMAPDIAMTDKDGKIRKLSDLRGQVVLLDFWASWCGPCRGENPNVVRIYNQYHDKGFNVFSVSLDNNKDRWLSAISQDHLVWDNHVSELNGWSSSAARKYSVTGIPATFLIDKDGKIASMSARGQLLELGVSQLLNK